MKYKFFTLTVILSAMLLSCSNKDIIDQSEQEKVKTIVYEYYTSLEQEDYKDALYHIHPIPVADINYKELALKELAEFVNYSVKLVKLELYLDDSDPYVNAYIERTYKNETVTMIEIVILKKRESTNSWMIQKIKSRDHYLPLRTQEYIFLP